MRALKFGIWAVLIAVAAAGFAQAADKAADMATLKQLEEARCKAISEENIKALGDLLSEDYMHVHMSAVHMDKATYLKGLAGRPRVTYRGNDLQIRIYGDTAVMNGTQFNRTKAPEPSKMYVTEVWVRNGGTWKLAMFQATRVAPPKKAM